jgi:hypothetical protein
LPPTHDLSPLTSSVNSSIPVRAQRTRVIGISGLVERVILLGGSDSGAAIMNLVDLDLGQGASAVVAAFPA